MSRIYRAIILVIVLPLAMTIFIYAYVKTKQPLLIETSPCVSESKAYFDISRINAFTGYMRFYSNELYDEVPPNTVPFKTIAQIDDLMQEDCIRDNRYVGTICFYINVPSAFDYGMVMPALFCEYEIIVNGIKIAATDTFLSDSPSYVSPRYCEFPQSENGIYEVVIKVCSPTNFSSQHSVVKFGTKEVIYNTFSLSDRVGMFFACLLIFSIFFCAIQAYTIRKTTLHLAFLIFTISATLSVLFSDDNVIMKLIPHLPYQTGVILKSLSSPLFGIAIVYLAYAMFKDYFPRKLANVFVFLQIIPLINMLCFEQVPFLVTLSSFITTLPYAICMYVFIFAYEGREPYALSYGLAVLFVETSVLSSFATEDLLIPAKYTYSLGLGAFMIIEIIVLAKRYSAQYNNETFYANELAAQLETMQASENAFLNAQMKPHFLYNTLNTIADLCVTDSPKAKSLIESLSEYLKLILSLDNMQETVSLKRELEIAERYMEIEGRRFPSIQFYKDYPLRLPTVYMPPIVIQPLIENAIKHGVRKLDRPGMITLRIEESHNLVTFLVSDNGDGMDDETIAKLFAKPKENKSIGIYNIDKRLKNKYGHGLLVESTKGLGTSVSFTIPKGDVKRL